MPTRKPASVRQPSAAADLLAFDIGGATIKAADGSGWTANLDFPLWRRWRELPAALASVVTSRRPERIVATMTGEICDCYPSRAAGVRHIVASLAEQDPASWGRCRYYLERHIALWDEIADVIA